jgi:hypothetical protein
MRRLFCAFILPFGAAACSQTAAVSTVVPETALAVDPSEFLRGVTCEPGQMRSYVATIVDMSAHFDRSVRDPGVPLDAGIDEFALPSSGPTPCFQTLLFQRIVVGRQYRAEIDGYDREPADIAPVAVGSRIMVDKATRNYVAPRWQTSCNKSWSPPPATHSASVTDGSTVVGDGGSVRDASVVSRFPDAALPPFLDCRGDRLFDGSPGGAEPRPWLGGPVCAQDSITVPFTACDPLVDTGTTSK